MTTRCIVVIGHVDHGKSALVRALTGMETDRLPEEKARGLSITPGYAHHQSATGILDFIDAPGHEDFIPAMVSGANGASAALIVISAVEGAQEQTIEHLHIAALLGIKDAVVAVTKSDVLPATEQVARLDQIRHTLVGTVFAEAPMHLCSAVTGEGCDTLLSALEGLSKQRRDTPGPRHSFLPIDRVFTLPGRGTIVTGTLLGQDLTLDDAVTLLPSNEPITLRGLQSRGEDRERVKAGERMAANLRGVAVDDIPRGAVLCSDASAMPSLCIDVSIDMLETSTKPLKHMQKLRVLFGTSNEIAQVRLFGRGRVEPSRSGFAQLRFKKPVVGFAGQRAVLRRLSPIETLGGVEILDPISTPARMGDNSRLDILRAAQTRNIAQIAHAICAAEGGVATLSNLARPSRVTEDDAWKTLSATYQMLDAGLVAPHNSIETCKTDILRALARHHAEEPLKTMVSIAGITSSIFSPILNAHALDLLSASGEIRTDAQRAALPTHDPITLLTTDQRRRIDEIEAAFQQATLAPPATTDLLKTDLDRDLFNLLVETCTLIPLRNVGLDQTLTFHRSALGSAETLLRKTFPSTQGFTTSQARTALNTTRRVIVPVLEYFDSNGATARKGDIRQMTPANEVS